MVKFGLAWIKDFDTKTHAKANGCTHLLLVNGHNSHYTCAFLEYACANNIQILCYPAHTTHVYQGLDIAVFGPLKQMWSEEWNKYERETKKSLTKETFLSVYGTAHTRAVTEDTVHTAFCKTGAWPFNPDAVTKDMMAPSCDTSSQCHLPVPQPSPIKAIAKMMAALTISSPSPSPNESDTSDSRNPFVIPPIISNTFNSLHETSASFLTTSSPVQSLSPLPPIIPHTFSPIPHHAKDLMTMEVSTDKERKLQVALCATVAKCEQQEKTLLAMQSSIMLWDGCVLDGRGGGGSRWGWGHP